MICKKVEKINTKKGEKMKILAINTSGSNAEVCVKDEKKYYQNDVNESYEN